MKDQFEIDVTEEEIEFFQENGFLSINQITTDEEIDWMRGLYDQLFNDRWGENEGNYFDLGGRRSHQGADVLPQVLGPESRFPELRETIYFHNTVKISAKLLGVEKENINGGGHMILKPAKYGRETPWHQDEAYWNPHEMAHRLSAWLPLDPATLDSGCMQFIPRSHLQDVLPHRHVDDDPLVHALVTDEVNPDQSVACPIPLGGVTFHHCRTLHYSGPNLTDQQRRAYILVVGPPGKKLDKPFKRPWIEEGQRAVANLKSKS
ncbi:phytanoyl-CoA dioxygenase [Candidatus Poribacteria bacterium]|nr:phytanoyl-CoA dioxygenase [Candidatus Poribacteria bacterium]